jgi:hypothetical protein
MDEVQYVEVARWRADRLRAAVAGLGLCLGCTVVSDFDVHECTSDEACPITGSPVPYYCEARRCIEGCRDNHHCVSLDPRYPICLQRGGDCVAMTSEGQECYAATEYDDGTMGPLTAESMVIVGAFAPALRSSVWLTLELAKRELEDARSSEAGVFPELAVVLCDDAPDRVARAMDHLTRNLGAGAIIASFDDTILPTALLDAHDFTLLLSPNGAIDAPISPTLLHLGGDHDALVPVYGLLVSALAPVLQERTSALGRGAKIAVVVGSNEQTLADRVLAELTLGGQTSERLALSDRLRVLRLSEQQRESKAAELVAYGPDLVILLAAGTFGMPPRRERAELIGALEAARAAGTAPSPLYLIGPRRAGDAFLDVLATGSPSFRQRAVVIDLDFPGHEERRALQDRYAQAFPKLLPALDRQAAPGVYDAIYYLAYAAAATSPPYSASHLREGLSRVTDSNAPIVPLAGGSDTLARVRETLRSGLPLNLRGVTGPGVFDVARPLRAAPVAVQCWSAAGLLLSLREGTESTLLSEACASEVLGGGVE